MEPGILGTASDEDVIFASRLHANAHQFIESAVDLATRDSAPELSFAAIHLATGIELLLKARLAMVGLQYLAQGEKPISVRQLQEGDFRSVTVDGCLEALDALGALRLTLGQRNVLRSLQRLRNRSIHYIAPTDIELKAALGAGLNLFVVVDSAEFGMWDPPSQGKPLSVLFTELCRYEEFVLARLESLQAKLSLCTRPRTRYLDECPHCSQDAIVIDGDYFLCLFCGFENEVSFEVEQQSSTLEVSTCPCCQRRTFARHKWLSLGTTKECFCCGYLEGQEPSWVDWTSNTRIPRLHSEWSGAPRITTGRIVLDAIC